MKKFSVHPTIFKLQNLIHAIFCITGLIIQIVQISSNFFKFEVVTEIQIHSQNYPTNIGNICFPWVYVVNETIFNSTFENRSKYDQRFVFSRTPREVFKTVLKHDELLNCNKFSQIESYLIAHTVMRHCFQIRNFSQCEINQDQIDRHSKFFQSSMSYPVPDVHYNGMIYINRKENMTTDIVMRGSTYVQVTISIYGQLREPWYDTSKEENF